MVRAGANATAIAKQNTGILRLRCSQSAVSNFAQDDEVLAGRGKTDNSNDNGSYNCNCNCFSNCDGVGNDVGVSKSRGEGASAVLTQRSEVIGYQGLWASLKIPSKAGQ